MDRFKKSKEEAKQIKEALSDELRSVLTYDFSIINNNTGLSTVVKKMPLKTIVRMLKGFETNFKKNVKDGNAVKGGHTNKKSTSKKLTKL